MCPYNPKEYDVKLLGAFFIILIVFVGIGCFMLSGIFCKRKNNHKKLKPVSDLMDEGDSRDAIMPIPGGPLVPTDSDKPKPYVDEGNIAIPD